MFAQRYGNKSKENDTKSREDRVIVVVCFSINFFRKVCTIKRIELITISLFPPFFCSTSLSIG